MPWKKKAFAEDNHWVIERYNESKRYIDKLRNDKGKIPLASWKKDYDNLSLELRELDRDYQQLKDEVGEVGKVRVKVYDILRKEKQRGQLLQKRSQDMER